MDTNQTRKRIRTDNVDYDKDYKRFVDYHMKSLSIDEPDQMKAPSICSDNNIIDSAEFRSSITCDDGNYDNMINDHENFETNSYISEDSDQEEKSNERLIEVFKGGKPKFVRKVDYLIDNIIRKNQKFDFLTSSIDNSNILMIPNSIGPSPLTDQKISKLWLTVIPDKDCKEGFYITQKGNIYNDNNNMKSNNQEMTNSDEDSENELIKSMSSIQDIIANDKSSLMMINSNSHDNTNIKNIGNIHAGIITHSDWGIEDIVAPKN